ncbi:hypothetical protein ACFLXG_04905 [Chloroflexota bacterium]
MADKNGGIPQKRFVLTREQRYSAVYLGKGDHKILCYWAKKHNMPMTAMLHDLIGRGIKCEIEKHDEVLELYAKGEKNLERLVRKIIDSAPKSPDDAPISDL